MIGSRRFVVSLVLIALEGLAFGVCFDSAALTRFPPGWWSPLVASAGWLMPAGASLAFAGLLLALRTGVAFERASASLRGELVRWAAHVGSFALTFAIALGLFDATRRVDSPGAWFAAWLASGALMLATWIELFAPLGAFFRRLRANLGWTLGAIALGALAFAVGRWAQELWVPLRATTFAAARAALAWLVPSSSADAASATLTARHFSVRIAPECSGYEGIGASFVFVGAALLLFRAELRFPRALWLVPMAMLAAWIANVVRLVALVCVGAFVSPSIAAGGFHSYAGTLLFAAVALGSVSWGVRSPLFASRARAEAELENPAAAFLVPFLATVAAGLVSRALSDGRSEPWFALRTLAGLGALLYWRANYRNLRFAPTAAALGVGVLIAALWLIPFERSAAASVAPGALEFALRAVHAVAIVPFAEELAFRGFLLRRCAALDFAAVDPRRSGALALSISALAFGALHPGHFVAAVAAGVALGWVYRRRGELGDAIVAHAIANAALVAVGGALGDAELWR